MIEVYEWHTGEHIKKLVLECISSYGITASQIYCLTTDNDSNMLKSVQLLMGVDEDEDNVYIDLDEADPDNKDEEEEEHFIGQLSESIRDIMRGFRCAVHTLQLSVLDALKYKSVDRWISKAHAAMKTLNNQDFMVMIRRPE